MKRIWIMLAVLLLAGCGRQKTPVSRANPVPAAPRLALFTELPLAESGWEDLSPMGEDLLLLGEGTLSRISGKTLATTANAEVASSVAALQVWEDAVSCYDPGTRETLVLDGALRPSLRISAPGGITGQPLLSTDRSTLFYCTQTGIYARDLSTGVSRLLKEDPAAGKTAISLLLSDSILCIGYEDPVLGSRYCFINTHTGAVAADRDADITITSSDDVYVAELRSELLFGTMTGPPCIVLTEDPAAWLPQWNGAVTWQLQPDGQFLLRCFQLDTGACAARMLLSPGAVPQAFTATEDGILWFLRNDPRTGQDLLCRWDLSGAAPEEDPIPTAPYFTADAPDLEALERCAGEAQRLGERFGLRVLLWEEATARQSWDYVLEPEHRAEELEAALRLLEDELGKYPPGFLESLSRGFGEITLCLVRSIRPSPNNSSATDAQGLQFWLEDQCFLVLSTRNISPRTLHHELYHLIDSRILTLSNAYDSWDSLNPGDFTYDYDYEANKNRDGSPFLQEISRSFIDTYSMSFPGEDRARIMEYAMESGNAAMFSAPILQQKLTAVCSGIRDAFDLQDYPPLPWEQYLLKPLAPASRE